MEENEPEPSNENLLNMLVATEMVENVKPPKKKLKFRKKKIKSTKNNIRSGRCVICNKTLSEGKVTMSPTEHGIQILLASAEVRQDVVFDILSRNKEGIIAGTVKISYHKSCRNNYTLKKALLIAGRRTKMLPVSQITENQNPNTLENNPQVDTVQFDIRTQCFVCGSSHKHDEELTLVSADVANSTRENVLKAAEQRSDEKLTLRMSAYLDLSAYDAKYHLSCYDTYISERNIEETKLKREVVEDPCDKGFRLFCDEVEHHMFSDLKEVLPLSDMNTRYIEILYSLGVPDPSTYRSWRFKERLKVHFGDRMVFITRPAKSDLVCSKSLPLGYLTTKLKDLHLQKSDDGNIELACTDLKK